VSAVCFGTLPIFGKVAYAEGLNVQSLLAFRFLLAAAILSVYVLARRTALPRGRSLAGLVVMGGVGYVLQSAAYFNSIRYVPAAVTSVLLYTYPAIVAVASWPLYRARLTRSRTFALVLALAGVALVSNPGGGLRWEGIVLGLLAAVTYSFYILLGKSVLRGVDPVAATAVVVGSAGLAYLAISLASGSLLMPRSMTAMGAVVGIAVVATVVAAAAFLAGLSRTDPGHASLISTLEPLSTALLAFIVLGQALTPLQLLGGILVVGAVVLVARG